MSYTVILVPLIYGLPLRTAGSMEIRWRQFMTSLYLVAVLGGDYEKRIQAAYPIHPEIFDRLYTDWSTLLKFQRTGGVQDFRRTYD
jgi:hypothetical protein